MNYIQATSTSDGNPVIFNLNKVLTIKPNHKNNTAIILLGAGLHYTVYINSIQRVDCYNELLAVIRGEVIA